MPENEKMTYSVAVAAIIQGCPNRLLSQYIVVKPNEFNTAFTYIADYERDGYETAVKVAEENKGQIFMYLGRQV